MWQVGYRTAIRQVASGHRGHRANLGLVGGLKVAYASGAQSPFGFAQSYAYPSWIAGRVNGDTLDSDAEVVLHFPQIDRG